MKYLKSYNQIMKYIKQFEGFERTFSKENVDKTKFTYRKEPSEKGTIDYNLFYDGNLIGNVDIRNKKSDWNQYILGTNGFGEDGFEDIDGNLFDVKLLKNEYLLLGIAFAKDWRGFNVGLKILKAIMKENNITRFYLWGSSKHPVWNKVATNTGFEEYRGTDYASSIYTLDIEQLNNIN